MPIRIASRSQEESLEAPINN